MGKKTIELNPDFLKLNKSKSVSNKTKKQKPNVVIKPNKLRKELLNKVKEYQKKTNNDEKVKTNLDNRKTITSDLKFQSDFNESLKFLNNLSTTKKNKYNEKKKKKLERKLQKNNNQSIKNNESIKNTNFNNKTLKNKNTIKNNETIINIDTNKNVNNKLTIDNNIDLKLDDCPPWGCIKNGNKPTYKTWLKTQNKVHNNNICKIEENATPIINTIQNNILPINNSSNLIPELLPNVESNVELNVKPNVELNVKPNVEPNIEQNVKPNVEPNIKPNVEPNVELNIEPNVESNVMQNVMSNINKDLSSLNTNFNENYTKLQNPYKKVKKIKTVKFNLGKKNNKIGVLIKDRKTRKLIQHEHGLLKQKPITEIKKYLREKNLIKNTSDAPNDVLRQLYEQSILSGDIKNNSTNTLVHNYLN